MEDNPVKAEFEVETKAGGDSSTKRKRKYTDMLECSNIMFPSQAPDVFRATLTYATEGFVIWMESKKTKQQWQATVADISKCGPAGFPEDAVIAFLEKAFEQIMRTDGGEETNKRRKKEAQTTDCPSVDLEVLGDKVSLKLTISVGGVWKPEFTFILVPVALDKLDVLEAKLRDAQEEIERLKAHANLNAKEASEVVFLSLASQSACPSQEIVQWDEPELLRAPHPGFLVSTDHRKITVLQAGVYQINVRLAGSNYANGQGLNLLLDNIVVACCMQSNANSYQGTSQLTEIIRLPASAKLKVRSGFSSESLANRLVNRFTILRLGD